MPLLLPPKHRFIPSVGYQFVAQAQKITPIRNAPKRCPVVDVLVVTVVVVMFAVVVVDNNNNENDLDDSNNDSKNHS